jgi:hypothetical protein
MPFYQWVALVRPHQLISSSAPLTVVHHTVLRCMLFKVSDNCWPIWELVRSKVDMLPFKFIYAVFDAIINNEVAPIEMLVVDRINRL